MQNHCIISLYFTPKLSGLVFVITEEIDFYVLVIAEVVSIRERNWDLQMRLEVMATFVAIQAVVKNGFHCTYIAVAATTAPCSLPQQYKELDLDLEQ